MDLHEICKNVLLFGNNVVSLRQQSETIGMRIFSKSTLVEYYTKHPQAQQPLEDWYETTKRAEWKSLNDIKAVYNNVDYVGNDRYVFNIKGNDYRLIVVIRFSRGRVFIRFIGTHGEYDKIKDIQNI